MTREGKKRSPEREQTDESLRTEREKTDRALAARQATLEDDADQVVQRARETADAVLSTARELADQRLQASAPSTTPVAATLAEEREVEDEALRAERAAADESLRREREENARALSRLLPLERDKTDRYLLTERVRSDDALTNREDFMGIVSHDLRNLLGGIAMSAALLKERAPKNDSGTLTVTLTARIQRGVARMNRLIGDLVDISSIDAGKLSITPVAADATAVVAEAVDMFQIATAERGITLSTSIESPLLAVFDHDRLLQVLANLIANAIKFTPDGGAISIHGEHQGPRVELSVHDTGTGIPADMLEAVFERFRQVGKNDHRGVGLGLYISRCIVEAHGGEIWAESPPGAGSTFRVTLPAGE